jgi:hypothetical protein
MEELDSNRSNLAPGIILNNILEYGLESKKIDSSLLLYKFKIPSCTVDIKEH